nr:MAG TPA: hypothetical protein [Caudoviricetes sp.]
MIAVITTAASVKLLANSMRRSRRFSLSSLCIGVHLLRVQGGHNTIVRVDNLSSNRIASPFFQAHSAGCFHAPSNYKSSSLLPPAHSRGLLSSCLFCYVQH